jgi:hypothetical protein
VRQQFEPKLMSSMLLWLDYTLTERGGAFTNTGVKFYSTNNVINGHYAYSCPFKPFIFDSGINGIQVPTGIYLNNVLVGTGVSGFAGYNYPEGLAYFTSPVPHGVNISGNVSIGEFVVAATNRNDESLLFETKYFLRPRTQQVVTGLAPSNQTYPIIFLKLAGGKNEPFSFAGTDRTQTNFRAIVFADSQWLADGACSLLKDRVRTVLPRVEPNEMPLNALGGFVSGSYWYAGLVSGRNSSTNSSYINDITVVNLASAVTDEIIKENPNIYTAIVDFEVESYRDPRL